MKSLKFMVLMVAGFSPTVLARGDDAMRVLSDRTERCDSTIKLLNDRSKQLVIWLQMVRVAEQTYKSTHAGYTDLNHLRKASLLDELVFESDPPRSAHMKSAANYVPATTIFEVLVSSDGQHFKASIQEKAASVAANEYGGWSIHSRVICAHPQPPILDGPQGPAFESNQHCPDPKSMVCPSSSEL